MEDTENRVVSVGEVINPNAVVTDLDAANKQEVFEKLSQLLYQDGSITSKENFIADVVSREREGKTGIGCGVAIPHGKSDAVKHTCIAVAKLKVPIEWESVDGEPVQIIVLFAVNGRDKNSYFVKLMSQVARMLAKESFCSQLLASTSKKELLSLFQNDKT